MPGHFISRREFAVATAAIGAMRVSSAAAKPGNDPNRLSARPGSPTTTTPPPGLYQLHLRTACDSLLYIPESVPEKGKVPLVVSLHGSSSAAERGIKLLRPSADELGFPLLATASVGSTWDVIKEQPGPDVGVIDQALNRTFQVREVDPARIAIAGISDGASCAFGVGLTNGDLFRAVLAFSPVFVPHTKRTGKPPIFISHGAKDSVFPVDRSRHLVPNLPHEGYQVTYREFEGPHTLPVSQRRSA